MSIAFTAKLNGEFVSVVIGANRREESPVMDLNPEDDVCGFSAGFLATFGQGEIMCTSTAGLRIVPAYKPALV